MKKYVFIILFLGVIFLFGYINHLKNRKDLVYGYQITNIYPHDTNAWCQGLIYDAGYLYEGTGRKKGLSSLRKVDIATGKVLKSISLDKKYFGEGITLWEGNIIQLTYTSGEGFVYEKNTFNKLSEFRYSTEGWGLTHDGENLIMSDGSSIIRFLDPDSFGEIRRIKVRNNGFSVDKINELEYVNNEIYANILFSDFIVRISPKDGSVLGWIDLTDILNKRDREEHDVDVMNCIAYDKKDNRLFVTGKLWPKLFEIKVENSPKP